MTSFAEGDRVTPGSERCRCGPDCDFPCWQRVGIAPACGACHCPPIRGETLDCPVVAFEDDDDLTIRFQP